MRGVRVVHVLDLTGETVPWDVIASCRACLDIGEVEQRVIVIGSSRAASDAREMGVTVSAQFCPPLGRVDAGVSGMSRAWRDIAAGFEPTAVQTWSVEATKLAEAVCGGVAVIESAPGLMVPGVDVSRREAMRGELGVREGESVVLLATDQAGVGDARRFAGIMGVLELDGIVALGVMSDRTETHGRGVLFLANFKRQWDVTAVRVPPMTMLAAADVVLWDQGDNAQSDSARAAMATGGSARAAACAGIPVVTTDSPLARGIVGPVAEHLIAADGSLPNLAAKIMQLVKDEPLHRRVGETLKASGVGAAMAEQRARLLQRWGGVVRARELVGA